MRPERAIGEYLATQPDVGLAYLFGSRVTGRATSESDWDVAVLLDLAAPPSRRLDLADALGRSVGVKVDVLPLGKLPIEFAEQIVRKGRLLFARSEGERVEFEARTMARAFDLRPELQRQHLEILEGGPHDGAVERHRAEA
jgi:predicted nucleotidyltransferase